MNISIRYFAFFLLFATTNAVSKEQCKWPEEMPTAKIVLIGEVHGTNESPEFIGNLACAALKSKTNLVVGLEIYRSQQPLIDRFMTSRGSKADKSVLLSGQFWTRKIQDGRSSDAMFNLIERLRRLRSKGANISVVAIDETVRGSRDIGMAALIERSARLPNTKVIALLGNFHATQQKGGSWDPKYQPAGHILLAHKPLSVLFSAHSGSAWVCTPKCGITGTNTEVKKDAVGYLGKEHSRPGYNGTYFIRTSTASLPAITHAKR